MTFLTLPVPTAYHYREGGGGAGEDDRREDLCTLRWVLTLGEVESLTEDNNRGKAGGLTLLPG